MNSILVTGGAGFIGSHFIEYLLNTPKPFKIINLDALTYAANKEFIKKFDSESRYTLIKGDICNETMVNNLFNEHQFDAVFHFAAESHVDNSISSPSAFINTNINGTFNLIHSAKNLWIDSPFKTKNNFKHARFHHISTDEVYGSLGETGFFTEDTAYAPNSPYSASKASSDFLVRCYHKTYGLNVTISNCSNNFGPYQHHEKLIPTIIRNALKLKPIPIYGDGKNIRDWLYVTHHCDAILTIFNKGITGETYNVGTRNELNNLELCHLICKLLDQLHPRQDKKTYSDLITFVTDRPGHDRRYSIDPEKIETTLLWKPEQHFETQLRYTIQHYIDLYDTTR